MASHKKGLDNLPRAKLLRGITYFHLQQTKLAEADFLACLEFTDTQAEAKQWLDFMRSQIES